MQPVTLFYRDSDLGPTDASAGQDTHNRWEAHAAGTDGAGETPTAALEALGKNLADALAAADAPTPAAADTTSSQDDELARVQAELEQARTDLAKARGGGGLFGGR